MKLLEIVAASSSFREVGRKLNISHQQAQKLMSAEGVMVPLHFYRKGGEMYQRTIGKTFGELTVQSIFRNVQVKGRDRWYGICLCSCGETCQKRLDAITSERVKSCGCRSAFRPSMAGDKNPAWRGKGDISAARFADLRRNAERRDIPFLLTLDYIWGLFIQQGERCALSGTVIYFGKYGFSNENTASLDRIDSAKPYEEGNVQWVHKHINKMKGYFDQKYFIELCKAVAGHKS